MHGRAMELQNLLGRVARLKVKTIDILCDEAVESAEFFQFGKNMMCLIGLGVFREASLETKFWK
jgi:hypothetical protein